MCAVCSDNPCRDGCQSFSMLWQCFLSQEIRKFSFSLSGNAHFTVRPERESSGGDRLESLGRGRVSSLGISRAMQRPTVSETGWRAQHGAFERKKQRHGCPSPRWLTFCHAGLHPQARESRRGPSPKMAHVSSHACRRPGKLQGQDRRPSQTGGSHRSISVCCKGSRAPAGKRQLTLRMASPCRRRRQRQTRILAFTSIRRK